MPNKKKSKKRVLPAEQILDALAGVLAMGLPYNAKGVCTSCHIKQGQRHHADCHYHEAIQLVLKYYRS